MCSSDLRVVGAVGGVRFRSIVGVTSRLVAVSSTRTPGARGAGRLPASFARGVRSGRALCGSSVLYFWPGEGRGWQRGRVVRVSSRDSFSHVVRYPRGSVIGDVEVVSLLDLASHGPQGRWVLLLPA